MRRRGVGAVVQEQEEGSDEDNALVAPPAPPAAGNLPGNYFVPQVHHVPAPPVAGQPEHFVPVARPRRAPPGNFPPATRRGGTHLPSAGGFNFPGVGGGGGDFEPPAAPGHHRGVNYRRVVRRRIGELQTESWQINIDRALTVDELFHLQDAIQEILEDAQLSMHIRPADMVGVRIRGEDTSGVEFESTLRFRSWSSIDWRHIILLLEQAIQSDHEIANEIEIEVTVHQANEFRARGGSNIEPEVFRKVMSRSRVVIFLNPTDDLVNAQNLCVYQMVYMGLCYLAQERSIGSIAQFAITPGRSYTRLVKDSDRYRNRQKGVQLMLNYYGELEDEVLFARVEEEFGVQIVVYNYSSQFEVLYPRTVPNYDEKPIINGIGYQLSSKQLTIYHVDFVTRPWSLINYREKKPGKIGKCKVASKSTKQCANCYQLFVRKTNCNNDRCSGDHVVKCGFCHTCPNTCSGCHSQECGKIVSVPNDMESTPFTSVTKCHMCGTKLFSPRCCILHVHYCRAMMRAMCANCNKPAHGANECFTHFCYLCSKKIYKDNLSSHECYIQKEKKPPEPIKNLLAFDFECLLDSDDVHQPYLCTAMIIESTCKEILISNMKKQFEWADSNGEIVFSFWGLINAEEVEAKKRTGTVLDFWIFLEMLDGEFTCFAHNSKAYDSIIVKNIFAKRGYFSHDVTRGRKFLSMSYPELKLRFIDSTNFIPSALRKLSGDFGIEELKKGYFPHKIMTEDSFREMIGSGFIIKLPEKSCFEPCYSSGKQGEKEKQEFEEFWSRTSKYPMYHVKRQAVDYCISDTVLLAKCLESFRNNFTDMVAEFAPHFDPFAYMTLASAMMGLFLSASIEPDTIGIIDRGPILVRREAYRLFVFLELTNKWKYYDLLTDLVAHFPEEKMIIFYSDCYSDGCLKCYAPYQYNNRKRCFMYECRQEMTQSVRRWSLRHPDCRVKVYNRHTYTLPESFIREVDPILPIDPRDAYKGGKVEVFKLVHSAPLQMCDYVSEYPTTLLGKSYDPLALDDPNKMLTWPFPIGQPVITFSPPLESYEPGLSGIIKCCVLPPSELYAPFLSYRVHDSNKSYEVMYGLCRTCMENRSWPCNHSAEDRSFVGTWTLPEIDHALTLGYELLSIVETWIYPSKRTDLFRNFITPFMVEKILSKKDGLVSAEGLFTDLGEKVRDYLKSLTEYDFTPQHFGNRPARRTVAKLAQNSFTGKWGEIEVHRTTQVYTEKKLNNLWKMFNNTDVQMRYASILDDKQVLIVAEYEMRDVASRTARKKNDIIVSYITAYGRIMLSRLEQALGRDIIYEDTDSAFHSMSCFDTYIKGFRTGDLELELPIATNWVSLGRKWYTYQKPDGYSVSKLKGFTLKLKEGQFTSFDRMRHHLCQVAEYDQEEGKEEVQPILIPQTLFQTGGGNNPLLLHKQTHKMQKKAQFLADKMKRYVDLSQVTDDIQFLDSFPFGYSEEPFVQIQ